MFNAMDYAKMIVDDQIDNQEVTIAVYGLYRFVHCIEIFKWLLKNKIKGMRLLQFMEEIGCKRMPLETGRYVIKRINLDLKTKPIISGRDYI